jgi:tRNA(Ile)-lysidine synthase
VGVFPEGYAEVDPVPVLTAHEPVASALMASVLRCIGGRDHAPRGGRLERLMSGLRALPDRGRTLGGCRIVPWRGRWLVVREAGRAPCTPVGSDGTLHYDGRFRLVLNHRPTSNVSIAPLGVSGWRALCAQTPTLRSARVPPAVRAALPALVDAHGPLAVPHLGWRRELDGPIIADCRFLPRRSIGESTFTVAPAPRHII